MSPEAGPRRNPSPPSVDVVDQHAPGDRPADVAERGRVPSRTERRLLARTVPTRRA
jgi:hypothetical protein